MKVGTNRLGRDKIRGPAEYGFSDSYHPIKNFLRAHLQSTILEIKAIKTQVIEQEAVLNPTRRTGCHTWPDTPTWMDGFAWVA